MRAGRGGHLDAGGAVRLIVVACVVPGTRDVHLLLHRPEEGRVHGLQPPLEGNGAQPVCHLQQQAGPTDTEAWKKEGQRVGNGGWREEANAYSHDRKGECGVARRDVVWCSVVYCGVVWCGVVWRGMARRGVLRVLLPNGNGRDGLAYG